MDIRTQGPFGVDVSERRGPFGVAISERKGPFGFAVSERNGPFGLFDDFKEGSDPERLQYAAQKYAEMYGIQAPSRVLLAVDRGEGRQEGPWRSKASVDKQLRSLPPTPQERQMGAPIAGAGVGGYGAPAASDLPSWVMPAAVGAGILIVGAVVLKKMKGAKK